MREWNAPFRETAALLMSIRDSDSGPFAEKQGYHPPTHRIGNNLGGITSAQLRGGKMQEFRENLLPIPVFLGSNADSLVVADSDALSCAMGCCAAAEAH